MREVYLKIDEVAMEIGKCRRSVYTMMDRGEIKAVKIGRSTRIASSELERWRAELPAYTPKARR